MKTNRRGVTLKIALTAIFAAVILLTALSIGYIAHRQSRLTVHEMAHLLQREISYRIAEHILAFLDTPHRINRLNEAKMRDGTLSPHDAAGLERNFWRQSGIFPSVSSVYFGNTLGGLVNSGREAEDNARYVIVTEDNRAGPFYKYSVDEQGRRLEQTAALPSFDARTRGWYIDAVSSGKSSWSDIYILFTGQDMALAASLPVYSNDGKLLGVAAVDVFLSHIARFLRNLKIAESGIAFVMERSGMLVASSTEAPSFIPAFGDSPSHRLHVRECEQPLIRLAGDLLADALENGSAPQTPFHSMFEQDGEMYLLEVSSLRDPFSIDWLVAVIVPEGDFTAGLEEGNRTAFLLLTAALLLSVLLAAVAARRLTTPILRLNSAAASLMRGKKPNRIELHTPIIEVRELSRSFNQMAIRLHRTIRGLNDEIEHRRRTEAALRESEEKLREQATTDSLTGLPNRRTFIERLEGELARLKRFDTRCSLLMIDIDHFKQVNDKYGHAAGDSVLKAFADTLRETLRQSDFAGRLGGEEFGVLLPETPAASALVLGERLRKKIRQIRLSHPQGEISVTASIGVAALAAGDASVDAALARSDEALYRAKTKGRDRVED